MCAGVVSASLFLSVLPPSITSPFQPRSYYISSLSSLLSRSECFGADENSVLFAITFGKTLAAYLQARKSSLPAPAPADAGEKLQPYPQIHVQQAYQPTPVQSPVQAQTTGGTYAPSPPPAPAYQQAQYTGNTGYAPTPLHQQQQQQQQQGPVYEVPAGQGKGQGGYVQELPGQYAAGVSPCGSPPQGSYGNPPR